MLVVELLTQMLWTAYQPAMQTAGIPEAAFGVLFAVFSAVGGIILSLTPELPISPCVTTLSFLIYLVCRVIGAVRHRRGWNARTPAVETAESTPGNLEKVL